MIQNIPPGSHSNEELSDPEIWQALKAGDRGALEVLFHRHYDDLYRYAVKFSGDTEMAVDHIQALFLKIWEQRYQLGEVRGVKTYLWTALRRGLITYMRKRKRREECQDEIRNNYPTMQITAEEFIIRDELASLRSEELKAAIDQLSSRQREVLYLKFYEGMSYQEIEQIMCVSYQTSRNYVYEALQMLKTILPAYLIRQ